jgi:2-methylcitrate dehydratase
VVVEYPLGHKRRRAEGIPLLEAKFRRNLARRMDEGARQRILDVSLDQQRLEETPVNEYVDLYTA